MVYDACIRYFGNTPDNTPGRIMGTQGIEPGHFRPSATLKIYRYLRNSTENEVINNEANLVSLYYANILDSMWLGRDDLTRAGSCFTEALPNLKDSLKAKSCDFLAQLNFEQKRLSAARWHTLKSLSINPGNGKCYMMIGNIYAASASGCGTGETGTHAAYWTAVDMFTNARNVDPSITEHAYKSITLYSSFFPSQEQLTLNEVKEGSIYKVGGWIGETTTVRASQ